MQFGRSGRHALVLAVFALVARVGRAQIPGPPSASHATPLTSTAAADPLTGTWSGAFTLPGGILPIVLHITADIAGLHATMDSPKQGAFGLALSNVTRQSDAVHMDVAGAITYDAKLSADGQTLTGDWKQNGTTLSLTLNHGELGTAVQTEPKRPQNPARPFPYREVDVTYTNKLQGNTLAATLTLPQGKGPFPAVLLLTGSGPQDRDETIFGHKPFLVLSDALTRHGIAVLRADDRGINKSTGDFAAATTADFVTDAEAGVAFLRTRPEIDPAHIGLLGHSEGGIIASVIAAHDHALAFVVLLASTGVSGEAVVVEQTRLLATAAGASPEQAAAAATQQRSLLDLIVASNGSPESEASLDTKLRAMLASQPPAQVDGAIKQLTSPWYRYFIRYDPAVALKQVTCPVLALDGSNDLQVPAKQNLAAIQAALAAGGNRRVETMELPGLNHLFQPSTTGLPTEYGTIETTISPQVLEIVTAWIRKQVFSSAGAPAKSVPVKH